jgi:serine/threonine protein kinase
MAPEILLHDKTSYSVDWWSLGIIFYQMLFGKLPYATNNQKDIIAALSAGEIQIPEESCSPQAKDLLSKLLTRDPTKRLGVDGANELMCHSFFDDVNWKDALHINQDNNAKPLLSFSPVSMGDNMASFMSKGDGLKEPLELSFNKASSFQKLHYEGFTFTGDDVFNCAPSTFIMLEETPENEKPL